MQAECYKNKLGKKYGNLVKMTMSPKAKGKILHAQL